MAKFFASVLVCSFALILGHPGQSQTPSPKDEKVTENKPSRTDLYGDPLPPGAIARLGTMRLRHENMNQITAAFVGDGKLLATGGPWSLHLWETATGRPLAGVKGNFWSLLIPSADGKSLAIREDRSISIRDVPSGRLVRRWDAPGTWPYLSSPLAFSPDGKVLVVGGYGAVRLWDTTTGNEIRRLEAHENGAHAAVFTHQGRRLVTTGYNQNHIDQICHWDLATGKLLHQAEIGKQAFSRRALRLSHDGRWVAVVPYSKEAVRILDAETGKERCRLQGEKTAARYGLDFSPDDRLLATDWAEDGEDSASISLWNPVSGKLVHRFSIPNRASQGLQFAPDGRTLLTEGGPVIHLWNINTGKRLLKWPAHEGTISSLHYLPDARSLISGSYDGSTRIWDAGTGKQQRQLPFSGFPDRILSADRSILSNGPPGAVTLRDLEAGKVLRRFALEEQPDKVQIGDQIMQSSYSARLLGLSADSRTLTVFSTRSGINKPETLQYHVWDFATGHIISHRPETSGFWPTIFSPDGKLAAGTLRTATVDEIKDKPVEPTAAKPIVILNVITGRQLLSLPQQDQHSGPVAFSPDGQSLLTQTSEQFWEGDKQQIGKRTLRFWELRSGKQWLTISSDKSGWEFGYEQIVFSHDGRRLATTRGDRLIQLWDVVTGKELLRRSGYDARVSCLAISPDHKTFASGHNDSTILVWDIAPKGGMLSRPDVEDKSAKSRIGRESMAPRKDLEAWWIDLAGDDAKKAHLAIWELADRPEQAVPLLRDRLKPAAAVPRDQVRQLLRDLDSKEFKTREAASKQLATLAEDVEAALTEALKVSTSAEQRRRIEALLAAPRVVPAGDKLRHLRAVEVLEHMGSPEGLQVLQGLAKGAPEARLTKEAKASLQRLNPRVVSLP
jgi:WD40 repeat protein